MTLSPDSQFVHLPEGCAPDILAIRVWNVSDLFCTAPQPYRMLHGHPLGLTSRNEYINPSLLGKGSARRSSPSNFTFNPPAITHSWKMSFIPVAPPRVFSSSDDVTSHPRMFVIPDLVSHCTFSLRVHEELPRAVWECKAWMINGSNISRSEKTLNSLHGLKAGGTPVNLPSCC